MTDCNDYLVITTGYDSEILIFCNKKKKHTTHESKGNEDIFENDISTNYDGLGLYEITIKWKVRKE